MQQYKNAKRQPPKVKPGARFKIPKNDFIEQHEVPMSSRFSKDKFDSGKVGKEQVEKIAAEEGRGPSFLAQIVEAMKGQKMPPPLLARLRTLEPRVLKDILNILKTQGTKAYDPVGPMGTGPLRRLPTAAERKAPGFQGVAPPPGPSERLKMEAKAQELSQIEDFESQMRYENKLREQDF